VGSLAGATALLWVGGSAILPLLPGYLRQRGSGPALVGVVMASYFAASVATQYPFGKLSDRIGRRPVLLLGLAIFAVGSVGFAISTSAGLDIVSRGLQGVGAGAFTVAAAATIGTDVNPDERGAAFGALYGAQMLALAVGPLCGTIAGYHSMRALFVGAAVAAVAAAIPVLIVVPSHRHRPVPAGNPASAGNPADVVAAIEVAGNPAAVRAAIEPAGAHFQLTPAISGALVVFAGTGLLVGVYETCWTLLMVSRHASAFEVGLSWTLFALPYALLSVPAGRLADRFDPRVLVLGAFSVSAGFCVMYPLLHSVKVLIACSFFEAVGSVVGTPAAVLVLTRMVPEGAQGRAQGSVETARTATTAVAAAVSGALFGIGRVVPFFTAAALVFGSLGVVAWVWRRAPDTTTRVEHRVEVSS